MGIIIWKERLHVSRSSYPRTSGYSSIMDMSFLPMLSSLGNMGFGALAVHPCRGWAHGQRSTIHHCPMHAQRQLSKAGSLALTAVEKCEYINILFLCVFVICMVCFMWCVCQCMESCVPTRKQVEARGGKVFFHCLQASCLATVDLVEPEMVLQLVWGRCGVLRFYLSPPPDAGVAGTPSYAHLWTQFLVVKEQRLFTTEPCP